MIPAPQTGMSHMPKDAIIIKKLRLLRPLLLLSVMAVILGHLFSCCWKRGPSSNLKPPHEQTHLIPDTTDSSTSASGEYVIDHQKLKDRMSSIVRSKEGKMVNVNARLPFNLHNKKLSATLDASSSSRSASSSTNRHPPNISPLSPPSQSHEQIQGYVGAPLTPASHPESSLGSREASAHESEISTTRTPILNVRLVKNLPSDSVGIPARRGRARRKGGESNGSGTGIQQESVPLDSGLPSSDATMDDSTPRVEALSLRTTETIEQKPTLSVSPASTIDFVLQDTGPLTVSWGD